MLKNTNIVSASNLSDGKTKFTTLGYLSRVQNSHLGSFVSRLSTFKLLLIFNIIIISTLGILMFNEDATPDFEYVYAEPTFNSLDNLIDLDYGQWAVAVDGELAVTSAGAVSPDDFSSETASSETAANLPTTPTASTAKMILTLAVMQQKPFNLGEKGETIKITNEFYSRYLWYVANGGSNSAVALGEEISEYDALVSVMLPSSNNMADTLAIWAFGSLENYRVYAQNMLEEWGITDTVIGEDASGFSPTTTSTSADLALIGQKVLENPVLAEIVSLKNATVPVAGEISNSNKLLSEDGLGVVGVKTGWIGDISGYQLVSGFRLDSSASSTNSTSSDQTSASSTYSSTSSKDTSSSQTFVDETSSVQSSAESSSHLVTLALLGEPTRDQSFADSKTLITSLQSRLSETPLVNSGDVIGYVDAWWIGRLPVYAESSVSALVWQGRHFTSTSSISLADDAPLDENVIGSLSFIVGNQSCATPQSSDTRPSDAKLTASQSCFNDTSTSYSTNLLIPQYSAQPTLWQRFLHLFGWSAQNSNKTDSTPVLPVENPVENCTDTDENCNATQSEPDLTETSDLEPAETSDSESAEEEAESTKPSSVDSSASSQTSSAGNCTTNLGNLILINPNFTVSTDFIAQRQTQLISVSKTYGIPEYNPNNGDNLMDAEAASHLNDMLSAYSEAYPGHSMGTRSCFRAKGTNCGRLCAATGTSDHHTGLTCDLIDNSYGTVLDTDYLSKHVEWQWLKENSYKYGFIDRFPAAWAGGSMSEPLNVDASGSTGLYETWHYRYVGVTAATEIATGKYNNGNYDSLEHYLLATSRVKSLNPASCN